MGTRRKTHYVTLNELIEIMRSSAKTERSANFFKSLMNSIENLESKDKKHMNDNPTVEINLLHPIFKESIRFDDIDPDTVDNILAQIDPISNIQYGFSDIPKAERLQQLQNPAMREMNTVNVSPKRMYQENPRVNISRVVGRETPEPSRYLTLTFNELVNVVDTNRQSKEQKAFLENLNTAMNQILKSIPERDRKTFKENFTLDLNLENARNRENFSYSDISSDMQKNILQNIKQSMLSPETTKPESARRRAAGDRGDYKLQDENENQATKAQTRRVESPRAGSKSARTSNQSTSTEPRGKETLAKPQSAQKGAKGKSFLYQSKMGRPNTADTMDRKSRSEKPGQKATSARTSTEKKPKGSKPTNPRPWR